MDAVKTYQVYDYLILIVAAVFVVFASYPPFLGDTLTSRLATVYSLTEHGSFTIAHTPGDGMNPFEAGTVDKARAGDRIISTKPPVLPLLMTAQYLVLRFLLGWDLSNPGHVPLIAYMMTLTFVGASYILMLHLFFRSVAAVVTDTISRTIALAALALATQCWAFGLTFNNHMPGAAMVVLSLYLALKIARGKLAPTPWRFALFGLAAGLVLTIDLPAAVFPFLAACYLVYRYPVKTLTWGVLGLAAPVLVHAVVLWRVTGSPLPVQMHPEMYFYEGSYWRYPIGIDALNEPKGLYLFHMTLGRKGVFSLYPILLLGVLGFVLALVRPFPQRAVVILGGVGTAVMLAYYVMSTNNYGGATYGFRWLIPAMPVLLWMGAPILDRTRARWAWLVVGVLFGVSFFSAWQGTVAPWSVNYEWTCRIFGPSF